MSTSNTNVTALYSELLRLGDAGEYDKALKVVNKILHEDKEDKKALHCKAVCLIHLSEFEEAVKILEKQVSDANFEKAYCFYRLNRIQEAYDTLKAISNPSSKEKELLAQVLYRLENFVDCFDVYKDLIKNSEDDFEEERETNLAAVVSNLYNEKGKDFKNAPQLREHTYELCYNSACILISQGEYNLAIEKLKTAEELCKNQIEENDLTEEEVEGELGIIRVQHAYALQMLQKNDRALKLYNLVLKNKPSDVAVVAVASNNVVTINKDQNVFDSKKKIKIATAESLEPKLTTKQRQIIAINNCLLLLHTNQIDQCRRSIQALTNKYPSCGAEAALLLAALHCKEKKVQKAVDVLKEFAETHPDQSLLLSFTLAQLLLTQGHVSQACDTLRSIGDTSYSLGVISALVTLYLSMEDKDAATNVLQSAIKWYRKNKSKSSALRILIQEAAKIELKNDHPQEAAKLLEELRKENPGDLKTIAQLIAAYSQFNPDKAKDVSKQLPPVSEITMNVDVDNLESTSWTMGAKYIKKGAKSEPPSGKQDTGDGLIQKKKKKRKKGKLPKNCDPNVDPDPERWLPRRERSTYKKKKDKRGAAIGKGTQGAVAGSEEVSKTTMPTTAPSPGSSATPTSPNVTGPRQAKGGQKKKKKNRW
ncbi:Signal recognition particle subunit SRP72 like protein [Argiope bruennichi]|uniref:Signal recognition particle subunit SRP72 n=1 Tax=Argiope bruennichi TaxID=94029 RepID=A0A8T0EBI5_ARGBR|nr:Signal recognition particle subunit SRP72 like protein [Argiope bruennichi]